MWKNGYNEERDNGDTMNDTEEKELLKWWETYFKHVSISGDLPDPGIHVRTAWKFKQMEVDKLKENLSLLSQDKKSIESELIIVKNALKDTLEKLEKFRGSYLVRRIDDFN